MPRPDYNALYAQALRELAREPAVAPALDWRPLRLDEPEVVDFAGRLDAVSTVPPVALWLRKLHAGTGTSIRRESFVRRRRGLPLDAPSPGIGAKGTDLAVPGPDGRWIPLAALQTRKALHRLSRGDFAALLLEDLASPETASALAELARDPLGDARAARVAPTVQEAIPCLAPSGDPHPSARAPGGHGFFAFELLHRAAFRPDLLPAAPAGAGLVAAIANGEDLAAFPERAVLAWLHAEQIPLALVATDRTEIDRKGGFFRRARRADGSERIELFERAQAEAEGPAALARFEAASPALFNTNLLLVNVPALRARLAEWRSRAGEARFAADVERALRPALIRNAKPDRVQLEGALGSIALGLDAAWRAASPGAPPLLRLARVPAADRTRCFSPVKTAFDFVLQFHSDRFALDHATGELRDLAPPGSLPPSVRLPESWSADVETALAALGGTGMRGLRELVVSGDAAGLSLGGTTLEGRVEIAVHPGAGSFRLADRLAAAGLPPRLRDQRLDLGPAGVKISPGG